MAIQVEYNFKGFIASEAYIEIINVGLHKPIPANQIGYYVWKDSTKQELLEQEAIAAPYDAEMSVPQAYAYLKTITEFAGAVDIFEEGQTP